MRVCLKESTTGRLPRNIITARSQNPPTIGGSGGIWNLKTTRYPSEFKSRPSGYKLFVCSLYLLNFVKFLLSRFVITVLSLCLCPSFGAGSSVHL